MAGPTRACIARATGNELLDARTSRHINWGSKDKICQVTCVHCRACNCQRIHWVAPDGALVSQEACNCAACSL